MVGLLCLTYNVVALMEIIKCKKKKKKKEENVFNLIITL